MFTRLNIFDNDCHNKRIPYITAKAFGVYKNLISFDIEAGLSYSIKITTIKILSMNQLKPMVFIKI